MGRAERSSLKMVWISGKVIDAAAVWGTVLRTTCSIWALRGRQPWLMRWKPKERYWRLVRASSGDWVEALVPGLVVSISWMGVGGPLGELGLGASEATEER